MKKTNTVTQIKSTSQVEFPSCDFYFWIGNDGEVTEVTDLQFEKKVKDLERAQEAFLDATLEGWGGDMSQEDIPGGISYEGFGG